MEAIIRISDLVKTFGDVQALAGVNLSVGKGEWVSIMGPSGSGKSTLLGIICGLDSPTSGSVSVDGNGLGGLREAELARYRREVVGLVFQQFHLIPYLTALENVMLSQYFHSMTDRDYALASLDRVGLANRAGHLPSRMSGGEQQRVCIARALINEPKVVLADEPTGNLDEKNEEMVLSVFEELHRDGITVVVVTHDEHVGNASQRIIGLEHGRVTSMRTVSPLPSGAGIEAS